NLNNRQRDHGRPLKPQVLQPPLESASLAVSGNKLFEIILGFNSLIFICHVSLLNIEIIKRDH
ncbi:hypothetical protein, partial [Bifidobacterium longum]